MPPPQPLYQDAAEWGWGVLHFLFPGSQLAQTLNCLDSSLNTVILLADLSCSLWLFVVCFMVRSLILRDVVSKGR